MTNIMYKLIFTIIALYLIILICLAKNTSKEISVESVKKALNINMTPRVRFEAISVGSFLAMKTGLPINNDLSWLEPSKDPKNKTEFEKLVTSDSSNNPGRLKDRIEYVRNKLLDV